MLCDTIWDEKSMQHISFGHRWPGQGRMAPGLPRWQRSHAGGACPASPAGASLPPPPIWCSFYLAAHCR